MKAIQTHYNGYHFRSRLEARWAVFFDALGVRYEYEPEGYELSNGLRYLPDFYLPEQDVFIEVKAGKPGDLECKKAYGLACDSKKIVCIVNAPSVAGYDFTPLDCWLFYGKPSSKLWEKDSFLSHQLHDGHLYAFVKMEVPGANDLQPTDYDQMLAFDSQYRKESEHDYSSRFNGHYEHGLTSTCETVFWSLFCLEEPQINSAAIAFRSARFEHGQRGAAA